MILQIISVTIFICLIIAIGWIVSFLAFIPIIVKAAIVIAGSIAGTLAILREN